MDVKSLREKAVLVKFQDSVWTGRALDRKVAQDVEERNDAKRNVGVYKKLLVPADALEARRSISNEARLYHIRHTLPWLDDGVRMLPSTSLQEYMAEWRRLKAKAEAAENAFFAKYPAYVAEGKKLLGKMYVAADYPSPIAIKTKFGFRVTILPIPSVDDWRVDVPKKELEALRKEAQGALDDVQKAAVRDLWGRLGEVVEHMKDRLEGEDKIFRNSLVKNVSDMVALLPKLNIMGDPELEKMSKEITQKLCKASSDELRVDPSLRAKVAKDANSILKKMSVFMGDAE